MSKYSPIRAATPEQLALTANEALKGRTNNTGTFSCGVNDTSYELLDPRISHHSILAFEPNGVQISGITKDNGKAIITFPSLTTAKNFNYAIIGV